jgi:hypothetical protein
MGIWGVLSLGLPPLPSGEWAGVWANLKASPHPSLLPQRRRSNIT